MSSKNTSPSSDTSQISEQFKYKGYTTSWEPEMAQLIHSKMNQQNYQMMQSSSDEEDSATRRPFIVALVGIPGSGKTSSAQILSQLLESKLSSSTSSKPSPVMVMPMDGYHLPLAVLKSQPNSKDLIYRRGAPDTFDPRSLLKDLKQIRQCGKRNRSNSDINKNNDSSTTNNTDTHTVHIPGFDHAKGDPEPNAYTYKRDQHSIIICEGLYLLHQDNDNNIDSNGNNQNKANIGGSWSEEIEKQFDLTIFINADVDTCIDRLKVRNKCIPGYTPEEIDIRCDIVDRSNAMLVLESKYRAMYIVDSVVASSSLSS